MPGRGSPSHHLRMDCAPAIFLEQKGTVHMATKKEKNEQELDAYYNERVEKVFPRPADVPFGESRTVCHNGVNYQIQYDVPVMVPRKVALIIEESLKNQYALDKKLSGRDGSEFLGEF